ncbi:hypothetical protein CDIK_2384 [Cucumispora dikerogammari]|nr:hypothetical protein CDIK_2384 [Cucumispora dikerogammari]
MHNKNKIINCKILSSIIERIYRLIKPNLPTYSEQLYAERELVSMLLKHEQTILHFLYTVTPDTIKLMSKRQLKKVCVEFGFQRFGSKKTLFLRLQKVEKILKKILFLHKENLVN